MKISMQLKVQMLLGGISFVALIISIVQAYKAGETIKSVKNHEMKLTAKSVMNTIDRTISERYSDVLTFGMSETARSMDRTRITDTMNDLMIRYAPSYDMMFVVDTSGKIVALNSIDKTGKNLNAGSVLNSDFSKANWFESIFRGDVKTGSAYSSDMAFDELVQRYAKTDGYTMTFASPIREPASGRVLGVWVNKMSWKDVVGQIIDEQAKIAEFSEDSTSQFLMAADGTFLVHPTGGEFVLRKAWSDFGALVRKIESDSNFETTKIVVKGANQEAVQGFSKSRGFGSYAGNGWVYGMYTGLKDESSEGQRNLAWASFLFIVLGNILAGLAFNRMVKRFDSTIGHLSEQEPKLAKFVSEIESSSQTLSQASSEQAASIEEVAASTNEMASMLTQTAQQATNSQQVSNEGCKEAENAQDVIRRLNESMEEVERSNSRLDSLVQIIEEIRTKTKVINDIVFETRLLSFNASIEAARAGAHGKGFAVVAEEVGKLATMSGKAADEIRSLLDSSATQVSEVVKSTQERVKVGKDISFECREVFSKLREILSRIGQSIQNISSATKEQESGIKQTNSAMREMDKITQLNARNADKLAVQSQALANSTVSVSETIQTLKAILDGSKIMLQNAVPTMKGGGLSSQVSTTKGERPAPMISLIEGSHSTGGTLSRDAGEWRKIS